MNSYYIRVIVNPAGAISGLNAIAGALNKIQGQIGNAQNALSTLYGLHYVKAAVVGLVNLGDAYTDVQTKIQMASKKTDLLTVSMDKVFSAANRSRTGVETFAKTVLAISGATANMNLGFDASVRMTETLSKMMRLGGASAAEAKSTITQYGQALRKGKLDGDEFRSVMENSLPVQQALAKQLKISTDELGKYSKAGKITRQTMVDALIKSADEVDKAFAQTTMRVADAWTVMRNAAIRFAGDLNIGSVISPILMFIADNFDVIAKSAMVAGSVIGTYFVQRGVVLAISAVKALGIAMMANPWMALVAGIVAITTAVYLFARDMKVAGDSLATIGDFASVLIDDLMALASDIGSWFAATLAEIGSYFEELTGIADLSFRDIMIFFGIMADTLIAVGKFIAVTVTQTFKDMGLAIGETFIDIANKARKHVDEIVNGKTDGGLFGTHTPGLSDAFLESDYKAWSAKIDADRKRVTELKEIVRKTQEVMNMSPADYAAWQVSAVPNMTRQSAYDRQTTSSVQRAEDYFTGITRVDPAFQAEQLRLAQLSQAERVAEGQKAAAEIARIEMGYGNTTYSNPLSGSRAKAVATMEKNLTDLEKDIFESTGPIQAYLEKAFARADEQAGKRKPKTGMAPDGGRPGDPAVDAKAAKERENALKAYEALEASISVVYKAELELANAQETLNKAMDYGFVSQTRADEIMRRKRALLQDMLDPYGALIGKMETEIRATQDLSRGWSNEAAVKAKLNEFYKQGIDLTNQQVFAMERLMATQKGLSDDQKRKTSMLDGAGIISGEEQRARALAQAKIDSDRYGYDFSASADAIDDMAFLPRLESAAERYANDLNRITQLGQEWLAQGVSQNDVFAMQTELLKKLNEEYKLLDTNNRSIAEGLKTGWNEVFTQFGDLAGQTASFVKDTFMTLKDAMVDVVMGVDVAWGELFLTILRGLADIATQQLIFGIMNLVGGAIGGGPSIAPVVGPGGLPGYADGGMFKVNGPPGRDAVFAPMMLTRGETVEITPRGETPRSQRQPSTAGGGVNVIVVRNDAQANLAVMQSPVGKRTQMANIAENETYLRTLSSR